MGLSVPGGGEGGGGEHPDLATHDTLGLATDVALAAHVDDTSAAHAASAVSNVPAGEISATTVQAALNELDALIGVANDDTAIVATGLSNHLADTVDAHDATAISFAPAGSIAATTVQAAIEEVAAEAGGAGGIAASTLDANTVLYAVTDNTPAALAMGASTILARLASGDIVAATPAQLRTLLALVVGTNVQAFDADLDAIAALTTTSFGRSVLDRADAAALRTLAALGGSATLNVGTAAGTVAAGDDARFTTITANRQTGSSYTLVAGDAGKVVEMNNSGANTLVIPANAAVAFPVGTVIAVLQYGAGQTTIDAAAVTARAPDGLVLGEQYAAASLRKIAADEWEVQVAAAAAGGGDLVAANNLSDVASASTSLSNLGGVAKALYDANTVLIATTDNTPVALTMGASTILARLASGDIIAATPAQLRTLLTLVVGTDVQAFDGDLSAIAALAPSNDDVVQRKAGAWTNRTMAQVKTDLALAKGDVGLGNVDNTADTAKPVSTAQQTALDLKVSTIQAVNAQTGTTYTLVAGDAGKLVSLSNAGAITLTLPQDSDATIAVGTYVDLYALGAGQITVVAGSGATLRTSGLTAKSRAQYARFGVQKVSANTWSLFGDLAAS